MKTWIRCHFLSGARRMVGTNHSSTPATDSFRTNCLLGILTLSTISALASDLPSEALRGGKKWVAAWASSMQGTLTVAPAPPYGLTPASVYNTEPDLTFALPNGNTDGAVDQTVRLIVKPDIWGRFIRLRFSNFFGTRPVTFSKVTVALQAYAANLVPGTSIQVTFGNQPNATVQPGQRIYSDPVLLRFASDADQDADDQVVVGRNLAVSFAVQGKTGPITYHSQALSTSYISPPDSGDHTDDLNDGSYPYSMSSWFFLDAVDVWARSDTAVVCAFGDSITDGTFSTLNGNDRWSNRLSVRLHQMYGDKVSVVNEGIGGNTVVNPAQVGGGPAAVDRLDRDVLQLSGLTAVVWLEGINDFGAENNTVKAVIAGFKDGVARMRARGVKVVGATITTSRGCTLLPNWGSSTTDTKRDEVNAFIRQSGIYDSVADMDAATVDPGTGQLKAEFVPDSTKGGPGDLLHLNRAGYQAMANSIDLSVLAPTR
jgi:Lysophospholipase L1 and related esterases